MSSLPYTTFLPADQERMQDLLRPFLAAKPQYDMNDVFYGLLILGGIVALVLILSFVVKFRQWRRAHASPLGLFVTLCRAHKLNWSERILLWRLARLQHLTDFARLFLEPDRFKTSRLTSGLRPKAAQLKSIHDRLFAEAKGSENSRYDERSGSLQSIESIGAALPASKTAPNLDVPPWPASAPLPPSLPLTDSSDGVSV